MSRSGARLYELTDSLDNWCIGAAGQRSYRVQATEQGWLVELSADRHGLVREQTEKPTKADALASAAMIVTHNPYLE